MVIAVDGPSGVGKSSVAKGVSRRLGIHYFDSGALYRAITLHSFRNLSLAPVSNIHKITPTLSDGLITVTWIDGTQHVFLEGDNVTDMLRDEQITRQVNFVANSIECRQFVNGLLKKAALEHSIIIDGRDIGTVVFPNAEFKFFLDASLDVRALRRAGELGIDEHSEGFYTLRNDMEARDKKDTERKIAPLAKAQDAVLINTDSLSLDEVIDHIVRAVQK